MSDPTRALPSLRVNVAMNMVLQASAMLLPLITFPYVARVLQPAGIGRTQFVIAVVSYFAMFAQAGIPTYGITACARVRHDRALLGKTVRELAVINLILTVIAYGGLAVAVFSIPELRAETSLFIAVSPLILLQAFSFEWLFRALERYALITVVSVAFKLVALVGTFLAIRGEGDVIAYGVLTVISAGGSAVVNIARATPYLLGSFPRPRDWHPHMAAAFAFFALTALTTIYTNLDTVMLGVLRPDADVGYFSAALKIKNVLVMCVTALGIALLPRVTYYAEHRMWSDFERMVAKALRFAVLTSVPIAAFLAVTSRDVIRLLFGPSFGPAVSVLALFSVTTVFIAITNVIGMQYLVPLKRQALVIQSVAVGAVIDVALNLLLIPRFGATGSAVSTLAAEGAVLGYQFVATRQHIARPLLSLDYASLSWGVGGGLAATALIRMMGSGSPWTLVITIPVFFGIYLGVLLRRKEPLASELVRPVLAPLTSRLTARFPFLAPPHDPKPRAWASLLDRRPSATWALAGIVAGTLVIALAFNALHPTTYPGRPVQMTRAWVFDPTGSVTDVNAAGVTVDGSLGTAWNTPWYPSPVPTGGGVGVILQPTRAIALSRLGIFVTGEPVTAEVYVWDADQTGSPPDPRLWPTERGSGWTLVAAATIHSAIDLKLSAPVRATHVLVLFTHLSPSPAQGYQSSVSEIQLFE